MGRHRIEIEFDADAGDAEWFFEEIRRALKSDPEWVGIRMRDMGMTPVIARCTGGGGTGCLCNVCSPA
jgi:hypothetical protein